MLITITERSRSALPVSRFLLESRFGSAQRALVHQDITITERSRSALLVSRFLLESRFGSAQRVWCIQRLKI